MTSLVPYLTFHSGTASVQFLVDGLGFDVVTRQDSDEGGVVHVELRRGDAVVMGGDGPHRPTSTPGLYLVVDDVDALFERAIQAGATEVYPPEDTEWGSRRARLQDVDGHEWSIGTYEPGQRWPSEASDTGSD
ncbi:MAG: VOC family protein [Ilumatobacteraceae bacterium]